MHVHGRDLEALREPDVDAEYNFDAVVPYDYDDLDATEFLQIEYQTWIRVFEDAFLGAELYYPELQEEYL